MPVSQPLAFLPDKLSELAAQEIYVLDQGEAIGAPEIPRWFASALTVFQWEVGHRDYPCHFGRRALERRELFVTPLERNDYRPLAERLAVFLDYVRPTPKLRQVLAAFIEPDDSASHEDHAQTFWAALRYLHRHDDRPWPADFARDPADPLWEFCFHGTAMFVFAAAPTHRLRRSRRLGESLVLMFQPRNVFHGIEGGTPAGAAARKQIRDRLAAWDVATLHPSMGDYGDPSNFEWRQYFIPDDDTDAYQSCPFHGEDNE
ncbi:YqcI/YcgG family protein [Nocardia sp. CDC160]|uniref:YqcI/YcgG family protein n=1 Tax=Nocardia sp. CDC160 TaxID=3112166 RepID=UPI002DBF04DA|nr:YqcI/YcgG family protein [Nocardia sp. CDC160]MEC3918402.1 YqcI/YcgG family protein [Nocardia sp. CDC160]MEC3919139.1 YqcI/YcgG family protein [Nocardia sp. CDC160]